VFPEAIPVSKMALSGGTRDATGLFGDATARNEGARSVKTTSTCSTPNRARCWAETTRGLLTKRRLKVRTRREVERFRRLQIPKGLSARAISGFTRLATTSAPTR